MVRTAVVTSYTATNANKGNSPTMGNTTYDGEKYLQRQKAPKTKFNISCAACRDNNTNKHYKSVYKPSCKDTLH